MPKKCDLTGREFERLTVLRELPERYYGGAVLWECQCDCGNLCQATSGQLNSGHKRSCGCLNIDSLQKRTGANHPNWHGGSWNRGSLSHARCMLAALRQHAKEAGYCPPSILPEDLSKLIQAHSGICCICNVSESEAGTFCLDHNHETGEVRDLICRKCNHLLGCSGDSPIVLQAAIEYLEVHSENFSG